MMKKKYNCKNTGVEIIQVLAASIKLLNVDMLINSCKQFSLAIVTGFFSVSDWLLSKMWI